MTAADRERCAILEFYAKSDRGQDYERRWGYVNPVAAAYWRLRDDLVFRSILDRFDPLSNPGLAVLEIGSGHGHELAKFTQLGIPQANLTGIDLDSNRVAWAQRLYPTVALSQQDATALSFAADTFDIVCQFTCVMHALSGWSKAAMCREMARVLKPGGIIIWWDVAPRRWRISFARNFVRLLFGPPSLSQRVQKAVLAIRSLVFSGMRQRTLADPEASHLNPIAAAELPQLFPGMKVHASNAGVDYVIWERLWPRFPSLAQALWRLGWLSHHCFAVIEK
jgi:SAM-dependent methyltransferase